MSPADLPTGRSGQMLALAIALLGVAVVWFGAVSPVWNGYDHQAQLLEERHALLQRMRKVATTLPDLRSAATGARDIDQAGLLEGASDAIAAAKLQERLQQMATTVGATLTAAETLPATKTGEWQKVSLRITLTASWPVLMDLLDAIERSPVRILVDDVHFHSATLVNRPAVLPVQASFIVSGFRSAKAAP
jgi:general secretion pathway protein M